MAKANLFKRMANILRAELNELIEGAEQPVKMVKLLIADLDATIVEARQNLALVEAKVVRAQREHDEKLAEVEKWQARAIKAARKGLEQRAATALSNKNRAAGILETLARNLEKQQAARDNLEHSIDRLIAKRDEAEDRLTALEGTMATAETMEQVAEAERIIGDADFDDGAIAR